MDWVKRKLKILRARDDEEVLRKHFKPRKSLENIGHVMQFSVHKHYLILLNHDTDQKNEISLEKFKESSLRNISRNNSTDDKSIILKRVTPQSTPNKQNKGGVQKSLKIKHGSYLLYPSLYLPAMFDIDAKIHTCYALNQTI